eukprot:CAMPEP_0205808036 /NCGR_PEP_ID=MMETSP0205-20121125/11875_1 /ASSEMBLY_ACC=CAM_ASM_000278 /TAXON_ID=36767 /ORGANISM="Euplotes focardii, Strain TN1" /LENGTH=40 /DNA_ID= /DNA_START= /DNA_END= /DNA_ORIENTATION=
MEMEQPFMNRFDSFNKAEEKDQEEQADMRMRHEDVSLFSM